MLQARDKSYRNFKMFSEKRHKIKIDDIKNFVQTWHPVKTIVFDGSPKLKWIEIGPVVAKEDIPEIKKVIVNEYQNLLRNNNSGKIIANPVVYNPGEYGPMNKPPSINDRAYGHNLLVLDSRQYVFNDEKVKFTLDAISDFGFNCSRLLSSNLRVFNQ